MADLQDANAVAGDALLVARQRQHLGQARLDIGDRVQQRGDLDLQQLPVQPGVVLHVRAQDADLQRHSKLVSVIVSPACLQTMCCDMWLLFPELFKVCR